MNTLEEQLKSALRDVKLTESERISMRGVLLAEIEKTPLTVPVSRRVYSSFFMRSKLRKTMPITLILTLLMSGGVSYAAEGTAPGDVLYPVKRHVNENMQGALRVSDSAKAKFQVNLAERRLAEVEQLQKEQRLDDTLKAELKAEFSDHRSRADEHLRAVEISHKEDADTIALDFKIRLRGHREALGMLGIEDEHEEEDRERDHERNRDERGSDHNTRDSDTGVATATAVLPDISSRKNENNERHGEKQQIEKKHEREIEVKIIHKESREEKDEHESEDNEEDDDDRDQRGSQIEVLPVVSISTHSSTQASSSTQIVSASSSTFTMTEIAGHNTSSSCYSSISGGVYDLTSFVRNHPGGNAILSICGKEGTAAFTSQHGGDSRPASMLAPLRIGTLAQ